MSSTRLFASTADEKWLVTTTNGTYIPQPFFGVRRVYQRTDFLFAQDDPLLYPQPYIPDRCHWAVIPRIPKQQNKAIRRWWAMFGETDFEERNGSVSGIGKWKESALEIYKDDYIALQKRAGAHREQRRLSNQAPNIVVSVLSYQLDIVLGYLRHHTAPLRVAQQLLRSFQRWYLELTAALDWVELFRPAMEGKVVPPQQNYVERVGAFTYNDVDRQHLRNAGVPVWHVQPNGEKPFAGFYKETPFTTPDMLGITQEVLSASGCLYEGGSDTVARAIAMENHLRSIMKPGNPFAASFQEAPDPNAAPSSDKGSLSQLKSNSLPARPASAKTSRTQPYTKPHSNTAQLNHDKFSELIVPHSPPVPQFWITALAAIDRQKKRPKQDTPNAGYVFPDPGMIVAAPEEKRERYLHAWLDLREVLQFRVMMRPACLASVAWTPSQWRLLLGVNDTHPSKPECLSFYGIRRRSDASVVTKYHFEWQGRKRPIGDMKRPQILQEIIWEIYELNFRSEFHALDIILRRLQDTSSTNQNQDVWGSMYQPHTRNHEQECHAQVQKCFARSPQNTSQSPIEIYWQFCSEGVAAATTASRAPWILRMKGVLVQWPGSEQYPALHTDRDAPEQFQEQELVVLEDAVARFYCQSFYTVFGRPPIIPHRLDQLMSS
ncbi:hypothetical protein VNI00_009573 [Paramarasmius palmivorus]|uniref:Uncharacterized protein n=1 Tax=Paramarasmius palmivorus TaxID=297713 RepID=A0AAW0CQF1_9AGAR